MEERGQLESERMRTVMAFFMFGIIIYSTLFLVIAAAQDVLAGTFIQTSLVLITLALPLFLVSLIAPYFMQRISYFIRITSLGLASIGDILVLVFAKHVHWKLLGAGITASGLAVGEPSILALTSNYHEVTLSAYSGGTGLGFVIAPLYYTAMTTWACVSPKVTTLITMAWLPLIFVCYYVMDKKHIKSSIPPTDERVGVGYTAVDTKDHMCDNSEKDDSNTRNDFLSSREKFVAIWRMFPYLIPIYIAWFSEYLKVQSVITTLAFSNAPFSPRDHYQCYIVAFTVGEMTGRSYLVVLSYIKAEWAEKAKFPYLWVLAIIQIVFLVFFILATWYRFLPNVWIVLLLTFISGLEVGAVFINALVLLRDRFEGHSQEFVMGYFAVAINGGVLACALLGLYIEPLLLEHCTMVENNTDVCFTRSPSLDAFTSSCQ